MGMPKVAQVKDIPTLAVLQYLAEAPIVDGRRALSFGYVADDGDFRYVIRGMPEWLRAIPAGQAQKLVTAKMANLVRRGWVSGCPCGCRGDFVITDAGLVKLSEGLPYHGRWTVELSGGLS